MIKITVLKNPFNYSDKEIHACEYVPGKTADEYIQPYVVGFEEVVVSINGNIVKDTKEYIVNEDDWIAVCPVVGKSKWFGIILSVGLAVLTGNLAASTTWGSFWGSTGWAKMGAGLVGAIGGALISHFSPAAKPDRVDVNVKPSYNWGTAQARTGQGNALAVTYGTMRTAGQLLANTFQAMTKNNI